MQACVSAVDINSCASAAHPPGGACLGEGSMGYPISEQPDGHNMFGHQGERGTQMVKKSQQRECCIRRESEENQTGYYGDPVLGIQGRASAEIEISTDLVPAIFACFSHQSIEKRAFEKKGLRVRFSIY